MKNRRVSVIISLLLTLAVLIATLPAQAQWQGSVPDFKYDGLTADGEWKFSWKKISGGVWYEFYFEFKGGGIQNVWTSVNSFSAISDRANRYNIATPPLSNNAAGKTFKFRVRAKLCEHYDAAGNCVQDTWYNWAKISVTF